MEAVGRNLLHVHPMDGIERLRGQLREASQLRLVLFGKVLIIVLIRELQQAIVAPILTEQRHSQPTAHRGMLAGLCSEAALLS